MADIKQERLFPKEERDRALELVKITTTLGDDKEIVEYRFQKMEMTPHGRTCVSSMPLTETDYEAMKEHFNG